MYGIKRPWRVTRAYYFLIANIDDNIGLMVERGWKISVEKSETMEQTLADTVTMILQASRTSLILERQSKLQIANWANVMISNLC